MVTSRRSLSYYVYLSLCAIHVCISFGATMNFDFDLTSAHETLILHRPAQSRRY